MFGLFKKKHERLEIKGNNFYIDNQKENIAKPFEINIVLQFLKEIPEIKIFENQNLIRTYRIETLTNNSNLAGQFLHCSIRIFENSGVMIDGIISKNESTYSK